MTDKLLVLDEGFVQHLDHMGDDLAVVKAARQSYQGHKATGKEEFTKGDFGLLRYLMRKKHWTPFEMCILKIAIRIPMDAWRQFVRHRLFSINEYSTRYKPAIDAATKTNSDKWRLQSTNNKQGSDGYLDEATGAIMSQQEGMLHGLSRDIYERRLDAGVAREQARKDLPLCTYTEAVVECDLRGWLHFLSLRMDPHAQEEIRLFANAIGQIVSELWPVSWQAFEDYHLNCLTLTACELRAITDPTYVFPTEREELEWNEKKLIYPWLNTASTSISNKPSH